MFARPDGMPPRAIHVIQLFDRTDGELVPGDREITPRDVALRRARVLAEAHAGAALLSLTESGSGARDATVLATFGDVPGAYSASRIKGWSMEAIVRT